MALAMNDDLTTGPMLTHYRNLAIPAALGMLFSTLYNVVDVYFAGKLSTEAQAGLAIGYQAFFIMMAVGFGLSSALSALVSNAKGEKNTKAGRSLAAQGLGFGVLATALLMVGGWFAGPHLIALVSEPGGDRDAALGYFRVLILTLPGFLLIYLVEFLVRLLQYRSWDKAYRNISFEREAYAKDNDLRYLSARRAHSWRRFL